MRYLSKQTVLEKILCAPNLFICLDFDGTLAPIRRLPDDANLSERKRDILRKLARRPDRTVAVISGRGVNDIKSKIALPSLMYAADHGFCINYGGNTFQPFSSPGIRRVMKDFHKEVRVPFRGAKGIFLENKGITLALHYRCAAKMMVSAVHELVRELGEAPRFKDKLDIRQGKMCLDIRPRVPWDKGSAATWLMLRAMRDNPRPFLPVYVGDDATDEDAFKALRNVGITVRVGRSPGSAAEYYLKNTSEVFGFLQLLAGSGR